jgi:peptidoglycan/xylan/chitin deacetylase (PgdA/CDA1 family)
VARLDLSHRPTRARLAMVGVAALALTTMQATLSSPASAADPLISQGKPVTASSVGGSAYVAANAVDGNTATRWASVSHVDPQWIRVDLGATMTITKVSLVWDVSCATSYKIQLSNNDSTYTDAFSTTTGDGATDDITLSGSGRYVRMFGSVRCRDAGYSLQEFKVYGHAPATTSLLSQGKPIKASSEGGTAYVATNANDGNTATRWASKAKIDPQWIRVDLGGSANISSVQLVWDLSCATAYKVQTSTDDSTYTDRSSTTTGAGGTETVTFSATARYVRMYGTARCRATGGYSLQEFKVFGVGGSPVPPSSPPPSSSPSPKPSPSPSPSSGGGSPAGTCNGGGPYTAVPSDSSLVSVNTSKKEVAITLDDGPWPYGPTDTSQFLATAEKHGAHVTMFMIGQQIGDEPAALTREMKDGFELGDHTWDHQDLATLSSSQVSTEVSQTFDKIKSTANCKPTVMRQPYGSTSASINKIVRSQGMLPILWDIDSQDWDQPNSTTSVIVNNVIPNVHPGAIILMHDGGGNRSPGLAALDQILTKLDTMGYKVVTISQLYRDGTPNFINTTCC